MFDQLTGGEPVFNELSAELLDLTLSVKGRRAKAYAMLLSRCSCLHAAVDRGRTTGVGAAAPRRPLLAPWYRLVHDGDRVLLEPRPHDDGRARRSRGAHARSCAAPATRRHADARRSGGGARVLGAARRSRPRSSALPITASWSRGPPSRNAGAEALAGLFEPRAGGHGGTTGCGQNRGGRQPRPWGPGEVASAPRGGGHDRLSLDGRPDRRRSRSRHAPRPGRGRLARRLEPWWALEHGTCWGRCPAVRRYRLVDRAPCCPRRVVLPRVPAAPARLAPGLRPRSSPARGQARRCGGRAGPRARRRRRPGAHRPCVWIVGRDNSRFPASSISSKPAPARRRRGLGIVVLRVPSLRRLLAREPACALPSLARVARDGRDASGGRGGRMIAESSPRVSDRLSRPTRGSSGALEECLGTVTEPLLFQAACELACGDWLPGHRPRPSPPAWVELGCLRARPQPAPRRSVRRSSCYSATYVPREALIRATAEELGAESRGSLSVSRSSRIASTSSTAFPSRVCVSPVSTSTSACSGSSWAVGRCLSGDVAYLPAELVFLDDATGSARGMGFRSAMRRAAASPAATRSRAQSSAAASSFCSSRDAFMIVWANRLSLPRARLSDGCCRGRLRDT